MKRYLFLLAFIFFLTGCQSSDISDLKPPEPTITVDNQEISYTMGTYSWSENGKAVNADSASPPELVEEVNEVSSGETLSPLISIINLLQSKLEFGQTVMWILKNSTAIKLYYQMKKANSYMLFTQVGLKVMEFMLSQLEQNK